MQKVGLAFVIGTGDLWHGFTRHHRRLLPWLLFIGWMKGLIAKEIWPGLELVFLPVAVILVVSAHVLNYRCVMRDKIVIFVPQSL